MYEAALSYTKLPLKRYRINVALPIASPKEINLETLNDDILTWH